MNLKEVNVGTIYKCKLSKKEMLVLELDKPVQQVTDNIDDEGKQIIVEGFEKVKAGKYVDEINGVPTFKVDELADGQLEAIND